MDPGLAGYFAVATALHFAGRWQDPFQPGDTKDHIFRRPDGETLCRMMWTAGERLYERPLRLLDDRLCQGARIPYRGERLACYALKPRHGNSLEKLCAALDARTLRGLRERFVEDTVPVGLPRIQADCAMELVSSLSALGVADLFTPARSDLSGFGSAPGVPNLYVDKVLHRASAGRDKVPALRPPTPDPRLTASRARAPAQDALAPRRLSRRIFARAGQLLSQGDRGAGELLTIFPRPPADSYVFGNEYAFGGTYTRARRSPSSRCPFQHPSPAGKRNL